MYIIKPGQDEWNVDLFSSARPQGLSLLGYSLEELSWTDFRPWCDMVTFSLVIITIDLQRPVLLTALEQLRFHSVIVQSDRDQHV